MKLGSHVGMSGKEMLLGSAKEALSYGANVFMIYTGAPQNTKRKDISELNIDKAWEFMDNHEIEEIIVHAPYLINLGNSINPDISDLAVRFLRSELDRTAAIRSRILVLHPGSHVGEGEEAGIRQIIKGINEVLSKDDNVFLAIETMAGKGSELGCTFEQIARIYDGVKHNEKLRVCFDTCHVDDSGYDIVHDFNGVIEAFDRIIGKDQICVFHINDSKNSIGARKDRHENIGFGKIGFDALEQIIYHKDFLEIPKILETPYIPDANNEKKSYPPYKHEIAMLRNRQFEENIIGQIRERGNN